MINEEEYENIVKVENEKIPIPKHIFKQLDLKPGDTAVIEEQADNTISISFPDKSFTAIQISSKDYYQLKQAAAKENKTIDQLAGEWVQEFLNKHN